VKLAPRRDTGEILLREAQPTRPVAVLRRRPSEDQSRSTAISLRAAPRLLIQRGRAPLGAREDEDDELEDEEEEVEPQDFDEEEEGEEELQAEEEEEEDEEDEEDEVDAEEVERQAIRALARGSQRPKEVETARETEVAKPKVTETAANSKDGPGRSEKAPKATPAAAKLPEAKPPAARPPAAKQAPKKESSSEESEETDCSE
ncbi:unnamed protein product, partial [Polarella glacialis]